jgi:hypothetical protein
MKNLVKIAAGLLVLILVYFAIFGKHNPFAPQIKYIDGKPYEVIKHEIDTIDIVKTKIVTKKGEDIYHDTTIYVSIPINVDTLQIIKDYFAKNVYKDTLQLPDSLGFVAIQDTISKNKVEARKYTANVKQRTIKETLIVKELPKNHIYYGLNMSLNKPDFVNSIGGSLMLQTKTNKIYTLGIGVSSNLTPIVSTSLYWKLK